MVPELVMCGRRWVFPVKTGVGRGIGHLDAILGVGRVVCIKHRDFRETNRNTNYLSAVMRRMVR